MPYVKKPLAPGGDYTYTWSASDSNTLNLEDFEFDSPPDEVGLASFFINTTDSGGGSPTITVQFQYKLADDVYGTLHNVLDNNDNYQFTSGGKFEARLDTQGFWKYNGGKWRIVLTRSSSSEVTIDYCVGFGL